MGLVNPRHWTASRVWSRGLKVSFSTRGCESRLELGFYCAVLKPFENYLHSGSLQNNRRRSKNISKVTPV